MIEKNKYSQYSLEWRWKNLEYLLKTKCELIKSI